MVCCKQCDNKITIGQSYIGKEIKNLGYCTLFCANLGGVSLFDILNNLSEEPFMLMGKNQHKRILNFFKKVEE